MKIISLLELIANNAHHNISIKDIIKTQSDEIQKAFFTNNAILLKEQLGCTVNLADRTSVFHL